MIAAKNNNNNDDTHQKRTLGVLVDELLHDDDGLVLNGQEIFKHRVRHGQPVLQLLVSTVPESLAWWLCLWW